MESIFIRPEQHVADFKGKRISETQIRPYSFANIQLTDDVDLCTAEENVVKNLGSISLAIRRATVQSNVVSAPRAYKEEKGSKVSFLTSSLKHVENWLPF